MAAKAPSINPFEYEKVSKSKQRRYVHRTTGETISRRQYTTAAKTEGLIKAQTREFRTAVKRGVKLSRDRAEELRRLASDLEHIAEQLDHAADNVEFTQYIPADIGYDEYTPAQIEVIRKARKLKVSKAGTRSIRELQALNKKAVKKAATTNRKLWKELFTLNKKGEKNLTPFERGRVRDLLEKLGMREDIANWIPPGFSDPKKRPKWWRAGKTGRYKMA